MLTGNNDSLVVKVIALFDLIAAVLRNLHSIFFQGAIRVEILEDMWGQGCVKTIED